jgi:outer membrane lipoprotein carrier protein
MGTLRISAVAISSLLLTIIPSFPPASAALNASNQETDPSLSQLIDGLQAKYSRMRGLSADFSQLYVGVDGRTVRESGRLTLKRPSKARWDYTNPQRKIFVSDGKDIYFHVFGENHALRSSVKESADPQIPFLFLLGRGNLKRDFQKIELMSDERATTPGNRVLRLVPKRAPEEFKRLLVEVNPTALEVKRMVIFERAGGRMDFVLSNVRENYVAGDGEFRFVPPAGVTVRDAS